ncbi:hypothetical protein [Extensimonas perlucida]|uniref:hypothetical protein n=1 Tax=Extensimonas perlucida TaxID=2590786 RepID=UPI0011A0DD5E|nr:hypothetical protein [Extensimonas perlucida]
MTTDHDTQDAHPPIPAPSFLADPQIWQGPHRLWLLYDRATKTYGSLMQASDGAVWKLMTPVEESTLARSLQAANADIHAALREHAKASKSH